MPGALASHVQDLPDDWKRVLWEAVGNNAAKFTFCNQKGGFPYDWFSEHAKLQATALPPRREWYNKLTGEGLTDLEWARAQQVWDVFDCGSFGDYLGVYLTGDVCGLADVFEYFRRHMHGEFGLDHVQFVSAASMSSQAMLRFTGIELDNAALREVPLAEACTPRGVVLSTQGGAWCESPGTCGQFLWCTRTM